MKKTCKNCGFVGDSDKFHGKLCLLCHGRNCAEYRAKNREKINAQKRQHYQENKEEIDKRNKQYYEINKEDIIVYNRQYAKDNKQEISERRKIYTSEHSDEKREYDKKYIVENKISINEKRNKRLKERRKKDSGFRLRTSISSSINRNLKLNGGTKNEKSILDYLDYTIQELKIHLKNQFEPWMTWDNHGVYNSKTWDDNDSATWTWQIDHIIPHSEFHYATMNCKEFKECWALENLRPLSSKQNWLDGINKTRHLK